jgi:hypothetical protein
MPIVRLKDGTLAVADEGTPERDLQRMGARVLGSGAGRRPNATPREIEVQKRVALHNKGDILPGGDLQRSITQGYLLGLDDQVSAGASALIRGVGSAVKNRSLSRGWDSAKDEYRTQLATERALDAQAENRSPTQSVVGRIAGALTNPIGASTGVKSAVAKYAPSMANALSGSRVAQAVGRVGNSAVGQAIRAGGNQAAAEAVIGNLDRPDRVLPSAVDAYAIGGATGGMFGAGAHAVGKIGQIVADHGGNAASRVAYDKIAAMLNRSQRGTSDLAFTPASAARHIRATDAAGGNAVVADLSPEMQFMYGHLSRKPGNRAAAHAVAQSEVRADLSGQRFEAKLDSYAGDPGMTAYQRLKSVTGARKAQGKLDYAKDGAMDEPLVWSDEINNFMRDAPPVTQSALKNAYTDMLNRREIPGTALDSAEGTFTHIPNLRTLDYVTRSFNNDIGIAMRAGDTSKAQALSAEVKEIKRMLRAANPKYEEIIGRQRDMFEQASSVELGESLIKHLRGSGQNGPEAFLDKIRADNIKPEDLRIGLMDALISLRQKSGNPVATLRALMRSPRQRAVIEEVLGGRKAMNQFDRFMRRELRSSRTDNLTLVRGSPTAPLSQAGDGASAMEGAAGELGLRGVQGAAFGGSAGALGNLARTAVKLRNSASPAAQEQMTRVLGGKGDDLAKGVRSARAFAKRRKFRDARRARLAGKAGAALSTDITE